MANDDKQGEAQEPGVNRLPVTILAQYVKDLSLENPNAPDSLRPGSGRPQTDINFTMDARSVPDAENPGLYEVVLGVEVTAKVDDRVSFIVELQYGVLAALGNLPEEQIHPLLLVELPRLAFPFARQIIADATQAAGFPPLLLQPVDFREFYQRRNAEMDRPGRRRMTATPLACIILAAGRGTRMKSRAPKVMHKAAGRPLLGWVIDAMRPLKPDRIIVVTAPDMEDVAAFANDAGAQVAIQDVARGTGDAVRAALPLLSGFSGDVLILLGDMPLVEAETLRGLVAARHDGDAGLSTLGAEFAQPPAFGRLILGAGGDALRIVEDKDCTPDEKRIRLCALGAYCVDGARLGAWVEKIGNDNAQKEFYFPDIVAIAAADGAKTRVHTAAREEEGQGVNSRADLAFVEQMVQQRSRAAAMANGATLLDPRTTYLSWDTVLGRDVVVEPNVFFGPGVIVGDDVHIKAFSHLEGAKIAAGAVIGPFARLRPGAVIGEDAHIGNFVEVKNATLGPGAKAGHHAYIGDAEIGARTNFSCGAITANYDGTNKHRTVIGADAMIGSNVTLVAPVTIGDGAYLAAGGTITKDVPSGALGVARAPQKVREGWARPYKDLDK